MTELAEVLTPVQRSETVISGQRYRQVGVRLWGEGAYEREDVDGGDTQYSTLNRVAANDVIVNKIWARNGSVAVVPPSLADTYCSNEFPTYLVEPSRLLARWFHWFTKRPDFWDQCDEKSRGTSGKNRIRPERFLEVRIPLPSLDEQRQTIVKIEAVAFRVEQAQHLRQEAVAEAAALVRSRLRSVFQNDSPYPQVAFETACDAIIDNLHTNPVYSPDGIPCLRSPDVGWGTLDLEGARRTDEVEYQRRTVRGEPRAGDIVFVREGGGTGKAALVGEGQRVSLGQRVMMFRPDQKVVIPQFMLMQILSPFIFEDQILPKTKGSASPHLNIGSLRKFRFLLPPLDEQRVIVQHLSALFDATQSLAKLQQESSAELDALMPAVLDRAFSGGLL